MTRPRSKKAHERVMRAALELFGERGIDATSMDVIAQTSGVSKATIYNHWTNKEVLLMDVMQMVHGLDRDPEDVDSGDLCQDLATVLGRRPPDQFEAARARIIPAMIAYSAAHQEFGEAWRHRVMEPTRNCLRRILRRGIHRKQLQSTLDPEAALVLLLGPMLYAQIFYREPAKRPFDVGKLAAETFWRAYRVDEEGSKSRPQRGPSHSR